MSLTKEANDIHQFIGTMMHDWDDGDFTLPPLAVIHMERIREKYRALGMALRDEMAREQAYLTATPKTETTNL